MTTGTTDIPATRPDPDSGHRAEAGPAVPDAGRAATRAVERQQTHLRIGVPGGVLEVTLPPADRLAFYAGLGAGAALGLISWPLALVTGVGHALADDHSNRKLEAVGEALEAVD